MPLGPGHRPEFSPTHHVDSVPTGRHRRSWKEARTRSLTSNAARGTGGPQCLRCLIPEGLEIPPCRPFPAGPCEDSWLSEDASTVDTCPVFLATVPPRTTSWCHLVPKMEGRFSQAELLRLRVLKSWSKEPLTVRRGCALCYHTFARHSPDTSREPPNDATPPTRRQPSYTTPTSELEPASSAGRPHQFPGPTHDPHSPP